VITLTEATRGSVIELLGARPDRVVLVPPGVGLSEPGEPEDAAADPGRTYDIGGPFFLYPAITYPHKNHLMLVDAFARVAAERPDVLLVLTGGEAGSEAEVMAAVEAAGLGDRVRRLHRIPRPDLEWLYRRAVALTFPSRFEGFGLPPLEAMASGCPVIVADATALPEVVADAGLVVPVDDPAAWATAMLGLLTDDGARRRLAAGGRLRAADFSWAAATAKLLGAYRLASATVRATR
jgi:alpha-1,3-rhamnosyl/mannosyltransferase